MLSRRSFMTIGSSAFSGFLLNRTLRGSKFPVTRQETETVAASRASLQRIFGGRSAEFEVRQIPTEDHHEVYVIAATGGRVQIQGSSAVAICRGAYAYLRQTGLGMICWSGQRLELPSRLSDFAERKVVTPYTYIQYYNVCTFGYTTPFWNWERWERELDWMALHGVNMPLAMEGQEAIWQRVWKSFGITQPELDRYFTGPAYLPWHRMGNIDYFEGPLPQHWIDEKRILQRRILARMRELGMSPVVPAFAGFVPEGFKRLYPKAELFTELWSAQMPRQSKSLILHPGEADLYRQIGSRFIQEYTQEFGPTHFYLADTFNEMNVPVGPNRGQDLAGFARTVYEGIRAGDPDGVWVMQGWLFRNDPKFWDNQAISAFLSGVPNDRLIVLDYSNDINSDQKRLSDPTANNVWKDHRSFFGKPWINGMIHTFGGNNNVKGNLELIAAQPAEVLNSPAKANLVGWGMDPEGIENNEVVYELMTDNGWMSTKISLDEWIPEYCRARYGDYPAAMSESWKLLRKSAYAWHPLWNSRHAWQCRPTLEPAAIGVDTSPAFHEAVRKFVEAGSYLQSSQLYRNDLIELVVQSVGGRVDEQLLKACEAHKVGDAERRDKYSERALIMLNRIDALLNLRPDRRLETWVDRARSWGHSEDEKAYYDRNSRRLITFWGWPELNDYAARVWSGLIRDYYVGRWREFFDGLRHGITPALDVWEESWLISPYRPSIPQVVPDFRLEANAMLIDSAQWN